MSIAARRHVDGAFCGAARALLRHIYGEPNAAHLHGIGANPAAVLQIGGCRHEPAAALSFAVFTQEIGTFSAESKSRDQENNAGISGGQD